MIASCISVSTLSDAITIKWYKRNQAVVKVDSFNGFKQYWQYWPVPLAQFHLTIPARSCIHTGKKTSSADLVCSAITIQTTVLSVSKSHISKPDVMPAWVFWPSYSLSWEVMCICKFTNMQICLKMRRVFWGEWVIFMPCLTEFYFI